MGEEADGKCLPPSSCIPQLPGNKTHLRTQLKGVRGGCGKQQTLFQVEGEKGLGRVGQWQDFSWPPGTGLASVPWW